MKPIIKVENLSKQYRIGARQASYATLRESLTNTVSAPFRRLRNLTNGRTQHSALETRNSDHIWALKDVSFEVKPGEVVGIIGRNGAGKSTLLKVLSRITEPTTGQVDLYGRVGSLLEVGTGFHPELTGRENIYLNGAILGMKREKILSKFDEIVEFSEIEKFIDTPVKHYSSGMYLRLAFAVAAHLEPDVLIVDEVLAVGDISFQRKCLKKMQDVGSHDRTVIFVSHDMSAITRLCQRAILLDRGGIVKDGPARDVVAAYRNSDFGTTARRIWPDLNKAPGDEIARLCEVRVCLENGDTVESVDISRPVGIEITYEVLKPGHVLVPNCHFYNEEGICAFILHDFGSEWRNRPRPTGRYASTVWIPGNFLAEGTLVVETALTTYHPYKIHFHERNVVAIRVIDSLSGETARGDYAGVLPGVVRPIFKWITQSNIG